MEEMFDIEKFNVISDEENYYFFRSLEPGDIKDLEEGNIKDENGNYKICCKIVYDKDNVKEIYGTDEEEKLKELIWQEVKKVNKTMPAYKYIREITLTDKELIKTTTQKIKRFEEMKNVI